MIDKMAKLEYIALVKKKRKLMSNARNQKFVPCGELNDLIKKGDWRQLLPEVNDNSPTLMEIFFIWLHLSIILIGQSNPTYVCHTKQDKTKQKTKISKVDLSWDVEDEGLLDDWEI